MHDKSNHPRRPSAHHHSTHHRDTKPPKTKTAKSRKTKENSVPDSSPHTINITIIPPTLITPSIEQYQRFLPAAQAIAPASVRIARVDVNLVLLNAARGVAAVLARHTETAALPGISLDRIRSLADLGSALAYAAGHVERYHPIVGSTKAALDRAHKLRAKLLAKADVLVVDGIVPAATVAGIRKGFGAIDTAGDCVELAALFHTYAAALPASVVVDPADVQAADEIGRKLLVTLRPATAKRETAPALVAAMDARDRLWTLFDQIWEQQVWRSGAFLFGREVDDHVPLLQAGIRRKRTPTVKPQPQPQQPQSTATTIAA